MASCHEPREFQLSLEEEPCGLRGRAEGFGVDELLVRLVAFGGILEKLFFFSDSS
jgi:hypothetical protein